MAQCVPEEETKLMKQHMNMPTLMCASHEDEQVIPWSSGEVRQVVVRVLRPASETDMLQLMKGQRQNMGHMGLIGRQHFIY